MRVLTLTQPWAGLVASGIKLVENRPRRMIKREDFGKQFAIHASREIDESVYAKVAECDPGLRFVRPTDSTSIEWYRLSRVTSAVIEVATLAGVAESGDLELSGDDEWYARRRLQEAGADPVTQMRWFFGPIGYVLRDVIALPTPVPCRGWQGFWTLPALVEAQVMTQLARAA